MRQPATPEELAARYAGRWTIYREFAPGDAGGQWVAGSYDPRADGPDRITADDIDSLADELAKVER